MLGAGLDAVNGGVAGNINGHIGHGVDDNGEFSGHHSAQTAHGGEGDVGVNAHVVVAVGRGNNVHAVQGEVGVREINQLRGAGNVDFHSAGLAGQADIQLGARIKAGKLDVGDRGGAGKRGVKVQLRRVQIIVAHVLVGSCVFKHARGQRIAEIGINSNVAAAAGHFQTEFRNRIADGAGPENAAELAEIINPADKVAGAIGVRAKTAAGGRCRRRGSGGAGRGQKGVVAEAG